MDNCVTTVRVSCLNWFDWYDWVIVKYFSTGADPQLNDPVI